MAEHLESGVHSKLSLSELGSRIKTRMIKVAECEQAIARLGDTIEDECMSIIKTRRWYFQKNLKVDEKRYRTMAGRSHIERVPEDSHVPVISISELSQVMSAEVKALEDVTTIHLSLVQLTANRAAVEQELQNIKQAKGRTQTDPIKSRDAMEDDNEMQDLKSIIEEYAEKIREHESRTTSIYRGAWAAMRAANCAAKSDIEVPGFGRWTPISAPTTVTTASDVVTAAPITVSTAQVKIADIPPEVKAAAKDLQASAASDVVATVSRSTTATIKVVLHCVRQTSNTPTLRV
jgi:flagellar biosynthesis/type III secretory pathway chaperone